MKSLDIFPTKLFEIQLDQVHAFNLLNEIKRKENEMKIISSTRQMQSIEEYITDYAYTPDSKSVELEHLNIVFKTIEDEFIKCNSTFKVIEYWTAIYVKSGFHSLHNHKENILNTRNYSGIIYLSDLGDTIFYSTSPASFETMYKSSSKMGKVLIFPSLLPHGANPTFHEENKRYIVSFNCEIRSNG